MKFSKLLFFFCFVFVVVVVVVVFFFFFEFCYINMYINFYITHKNIPVILLVNTTSRDIKYYAYIPDI